MDLGLLEYSGKLYLIDWDLQEFLYLEKWEHIPMCSRYGRGLLQAYKENNK